MKILLVSVLLTVFALPTYVKHNYSWKNKASPSKVVYMNTGKMNVNDFHNGTVKFNEPVAYKVPDFVVKQKRLSWNH